MAVKAELDLREILLTTGLVQPIKVEGRGGRLSALCREVPGQAQAWLKVVETLLRESAGTDMSFHMCRQYVWKDGRMVFGWHVGVEAKSASDSALHITWLRELLRNIEPELTQEAPPAAVASPTTAPPPEEDDPDLEAPELPPTADMLARQAEFRKHTSATPRAAAPVPSGISVSEPDQVAKPVIRVVQKGSAKDQKNRTVPVIVEEYPLPHVFGEDMNAPNEKGRGATTLG
jgi:hypothetical protein